MAFCEHCAREIKTYLCVCSIAQECREVLSQDVKLYNTEHWIRGKQGYVCRINHILLEPVVFAYYMVHDAPPPQTAQSAYYVHLIPQILLPDSVICSVRVVVVPLCCSCGFYLCFLDDSDLRFECVLFVVCSIGGLVYVHALSIYLLWFRTIELDELNPNATIRPQRHRPSLFRVLRHEEHQQKRN